MTCTGWPTWYRRAPQTRRYRGSWRQRWLDLGTTWLKQFGLFTGTKAVANSAAAQAIPQWSKVWEPLYAKGKYLENLDHGDQIDSIISSALDSILLSDSNVKSALATANAQIIPLLNQCYRENVTKAACSTRRRASILDNGRDPPPQDGHRVRAGAPVCNYRASHAHHPRWTERACDVG